MTQWTLKAYFYVIYTVKSCGSGLFHKKDKQTLLIWIFSVLQYYERILMKELASLHMLTLVNISPRTNLNMLMQPFQRLVLLLNHMQIFSWHACVWTSFCNGYCCTVSFSFSSLRSHAVQKQACKALLGDIVYKLFICKGVYGKVPWVGKIKEIIINLSNRIIQYASSCTYKLPLSK